MLPLKLADLLGIDQEPKKVEIAPSLNSPTSSLSSQGPLPCPEPMHVSTSKLAIAAGSGNSNTGSVLHGTPNVRLADVTQPFLQAAPHTSTLDANKDSTQYAYNHTRREKARTLLIAYLPRCATDKDLERIFGGPKNVRSISIVRDARGVSKCYGFARFSSHEVARAALEACYQGSIILEDDNFKAWHLKASWARTEHKERHREMTSATNRHVCHEADAPVVAEGIAGKDVHSCQCMQESTLLPQSLL